MLGTRSAGVFLSLSCAFALPSIAQLPDVDDRRLGVDCLKLIGGPRIYGFSLGEFSPGDSSDASLRFAVQRSWLEATYPDMFNRAVEQEATERETTRQSLLERIDEWVAERQLDSDQELLRFLASERNRIASADGSPTTPALFLLLDVPRNQIRELTVAKPQLRHVAGIAYQHDFVNIVRTPATLLLKKMQEQGIDPSTETVDLSDHLPQWTHQTDRQWATRQALVEFRMRKPLEYQGTGTTLLRRSDQPDGAEADIGALIGQLLSSSSGDAISQLGAELGLPEFQDQRSDNQLWWKNIATEAEKDGFRGVLTTRLKQNLLSPQVTVETSFLVKESEGNWFIALEFVSRADANQQPAERIDRIREDPQIQSVVSALKALGLDASDRIEQALRHGAATEFAMNQATGQFFTLLSKHINHLDRPEIELAN